MEMHGEAVSPSLCSYLEGEVGSYVVPFSERTSITDLPS